MNKLHTLILMCLLSLVGISANALVFHSCNANHDGKVDDPYNGHEYVDLGLSVKWATCNVGAVSPEDYGDYFAWGETEPKDFYAWSTYKWCNGSYDTLTKYCTDSKYGTVDNKTVLDLEDDAAHVNWGGDWRMPTKAEQDELYNNCTWEWTTQNGVNGYKVTSKINGNYNVIITNNCTDMLLSVKHKCNLQPMFICQL